jgi:Rrf2 family protein
MIELAGNYSDSPLPLKDIAERQNVSKGYLEHIIPLLRSAGLIKSVRGPGGGYVLSREPARITLFEILGALEGSFDPVDCVSDPEICTRTGVCASRDVWIDLKGIITSRLKEILLSELMIKQDNKTSAGPDTQNSLHGMSSVI